MFYTTFAVDTLNLDKSSDFLRNLDFFSAFPTQPKFTYDSFAKCHIWDKFLNDLFQK